VLDRRLPVAVCDDSTAWSVPGHTVSVCFVFHDYGLADPPPKVASKILTKTADSAVVHWHGSSF
jgi:hypothetical protein